MAYAPGYAPGQTPYYTPPTAVTAPATSPTPTSTTSSVPDSAVGWDAANLRLAQLQQLRAALDAGKLSVQDFLSQATPIAQKINDDSWSLARRDSTGAKQSTQLNSMLVNLGFAQDPSNTQKVIQQLPTQYQGDAQKTEQPTNLLPGQEDRNATIPNNITAGSDQYKIEEEGARQAQQQADLAAQQKAAHASSLSDYAKVLADNQQQTFNHELPDLAEQANTKGIYRSTGFGDSLAREYANLTANTQNQLAQKAIQYGDLDTAALSNATNIAQSYQAQGLNRSLSLEDYNKQVQDAVRYGKEFQPVQQGKTGGQKALDTVGAVNSTVSSKTGGSSGNSKVVGAGKFLV